MTLQQRFVAALLARGCVQVGEMAHGCVKLSRPSREGTFYFVGSAGSLRYGPTRTASVPVGDKFKERLLASV